MYGYGVWFHIFPKWISLKMGISTDGQEQSRDRFERRTARTLGGMVADNYIIIHKGTNMIHISSVCRKARRLEGIEGN